MKLSDTLIPERICLDLRSANKEGVIRELVELAAQFGPLENASAFLERVLEREFLLSTGIGYGVAVPHAQDPSIEGLYCCLGISREGVDYDAIDDEPARIICLIAAEEGNDGPYLLLLSQISRLFAQGHVREAVLEAESPDGVLDAIRNAEAALGTRAS